MKRLRKCGIAAVIGEQNIVSNIDQAIAWAEHILYGNASIGSASQPVNP